MRGIGKASRSLSVQVPVDAALARGVLQNDGRIGQQRVDAVPQPRLVLGLRGRHHVLQATVHVLGILRLPASPGSLWVAAGYMTSCSHARLPGSPSLAALQHACSAWPLTFFRFTPFISGTSASYGAGMDVSTRSRHFPPSPPGGGRLTVTDRCDVLSAMNNELTLSSLREKKPAALHAVES